MKLRVEIDVDWNDLSAIAEVCGLTPTEGCCRKIRGQRAAQERIETNMRDAARGLIFRAHQMHDHQEKARVEKAQQAVQPEAAGPQGSGEGGGPVEGA